MRLILEVMKDESDPDQMEEPLKLKKKIQYIDDEIINRRSIQRKLLKIR